MKSYFDNQKKLTHYFRVTADFAGGERHYIGSYLNERLSKLVLTIIDSFGEANAEIRKAGGLNIRIQEYADETIKCPAGIRLKDTPRGRITMIETNLSSKELRGLADRADFLVEEAARLNKNFESQILPEAELSFRR